MCLISHAHAQVTYLGVSLGSGWGYFNNVAQFSRLKDKDAFDLVEVSGFFAYKPRKPAFSVASGISYEMFETRDRRHNYIKVPLGLDFEIGKKYQVLFGIGMYGQFYLNSTLKNYNAFSDAQAGYSANLGFGYVLKEKYSFFIKFRKENDITQMYKEELPSHFGHDYQMVYAYKYYFTLGFYLRIKKAVA